MATALQSLETKLNEMLVTNAPVQLPENARKWIATYAWIFALLGAVFGAFAILVLLPALGFASVVGAAVGVGGYVLMAWLALLFLVGNTVLWAMATPKLKAMQKSGWNLVFYGSLLSLAYDVFNNFRVFSAGSVFSLIWSLLLSLVGLYFLFQVRSYFLGKKTDPVAAKKA